MQRFYAIVILIFTATYLQAQINEVPLANNPILEKIQVEKEQKTQTMLQKRLAKMNLPSPTRDVFFANGMCVEADSSFVICTDTTNLGMGTTFDLVNIGAINNGTTIIDSTCITYTANSGVDFAIDSIFVEVCAGITGECDTTVYPLFIHRANNETVVPTTTINAEDTVTICVDVTTLPTAFTGAGVLDNDPLLGDATQFGNCIFYDANRFAGTDTVTFEVCDEYCVCDIYLIPITILQDTIGLPFMDDFSTSGPYPNDKWLDQRVFVNNTMSIEPVSVGVATFDGLNEGGAPYGGGFGVSDDLTSAYFDMSPYNAGSNIWLSFYLEPQGLGETPEDQDSLLLQYKNEMNEWVTIDVFTDNTFEKDTTFFPPDTFFMLVDTMIGGIDTFVFDTILYPVFNTTPQFNYQSYNITSNDYLFNGFQFRFRSYSSRSGNIDHWHLDYVRLASGLSGSPFLDDVAFMEPPNPILKNYTSMPWWHFVGNKDNEVAAENTFNKVRIFSHDDTNNSLPDTEIEITELESGTMLVDDLELFSSGTNVAPGFFPTFFPTPAFDTYPDFISSIQNDFSDNLKYLEFEKTYFFDLGAENPNVNPIVEDNNTVSSTTIFDNYFAYDDGTAENGFEANSNNVQIAVKYHANVSDSLKAVQFHFPHILANASNQLFNLKIWIGELDDEAEYVAQLQKPLYIDSYLDSLNGFTTYILTDPSGERAPLAIPAGDFYVGWQQVTPCQIFECIAVGLDQNNPNGMQNTFVDGFGFGLSWKGVLEQNPTLTGSVMIRPVFGEGEPQASSKTEDVTVNTQFDVFPNPTTGLLNIEIENGNFNDFDYMIFDAVGKRLAAQPLTNQLNISHLQNGIYFIQIRNTRTNELFNKKIILLD